MCRYVCIGGFFIFPLPCYTFLMSELPGAQEAVPTRTEREEVAEILALAKELVESGEVFPFPGIKADEYAAMQAADIEYPGCSTPTSEIMERMKMEGIKVAFSPHPENINVLILPAGSNDTAEDIILPRHLEMNEQMDPRLKQLILLIVAHREAKQAQ